MSFVPQENKARPMLKIAKSPSGGSAPTRWLVGQNTSISMILNGGSALHSSQELNVNSALCGITIPMSSCSRKPVGEPHKRNLGRRKNCHPR